MLALVAALAAVHDGTWQPWVVENVCILALVVLKCFATESCPTWWMFGLSNILIVEGSILVQTVLNHTVYRHVPPMHATSHRWQDMMRNVLTATLPVHALSTLAVRAMWDAEMATAYRFEDDLVHFDVTGFACKLVLFRLLSDVVFYATHRWQHSNPRIYKALHAKHHRHYTTSLRTNFQFTAVDLFLEGSLPSLVATLLLEPLCSLTVFEANLCLACMQWYQIGSHNSKDVGCVTAVPPLSPLYNHSWLWRPEALREHRHIRFHAAHHRFVTCHYGISPWLDVLLGTLPNASASTLSRQQQTASKEARSTCGNS